MNNNEVKANTWGNSCSQKGGQTALYWFPPGGAFSFEGIPLCEICSLTPLPSPSLLPYGVMTFCPPPPHPDLADPVSRHRINCWPAAVALTLPPSLHIHTHTHTHTNTQTKLHHPPSSTPLWYYTQPILLTFCVNMTSGRTAPVLSSAEYLIAS